MTEQTHPEYPIRHGAPAMDRCKCGGVRHWHAMAPYGCDDCACTGFVLDEDWRAPAHNDEIRTNVESAIAYLRFHAGEIDRAWVIELLDSVPSGGPLNGEGI